LYVLLALFAFAASAASLAGVTLPDSATVGGQSLVLNGLGLREKYYLDIYVGALYLPARSRDSASIIAQDVPKRVVMHFIYDDVPKDKITETMYEGLSRYPEYASLKPLLDQACAHAEDMKKGQEMSFDYVPGQGTIVYVKGKKKAVIPGQDFMKLVFSIYVGPHPANEALKKGMLGG
jgi:Chalcone isomerase-like